MSNSTAVALVGSQNTTGVNKYMNNASALGVPGMNRLNNMLKRTDVRGMAGADWELMKLMLVVEPMLTYLIAKVYVTARRKVLGARGRAPSMNNANNRRLLANTNAASLSVLNNTNALRRAMNNAARRKNARNVALIQDGLHTAVFGLITVMSTVDILNYYFSVSRLNASTQPDEFFDVAYNAIILMSRIVLPLILAIIQRVFKRSNAGTKAVLLSSVAAIMLVTQIDSRALNSMRSTVNNVRNSFVKLKTKTSMINTAARLINPSITNKKQQALGLAITSARDTLRSIIQVLGKVIAGAIAVNKGKNAFNTTKRNNRTVRITNVNRNNRRPMRLTNGTNNGRNMNNAANTLLKMRANRS